MKTRKLTKKSLNELAQVMPVLSEKEQDELVGGAQLFTKDGTYLGQVGTSQEVRITTENTYTQLQSYDLSYQDSLVGNMSAGLSGQAIQTMEKVMNSIAQMAGIDSGIKIEVKNVQGWTAYGSTTSTGGIWLNANSDTIVYDGCNMYDFMSTIIHENYHLHDTTDKRYGDQRELNALYAEQSGYYYSLTSDAYKKENNTNIRKVKEKLENYNNQPLS